MTALVSYSTGTVSVAANGTTVTGASTIWSGVNARPGDILQIGDFQTIISDVTDPTHLVIPPWGGGVQAGVAYTIWQVSPQRFAGAQAMQSVNQMVAALNTSGFFWFVDASLPAPDPSYGEDGQYAFQPTTGKMWFKGGGTWNYLGVYKGFGTPAPYDNAHTYNLMDVATSNGSSYVWINQTPGSGQAPPNATYWALLAAKGDTGATGATGAPGVNAPTYGGTSTTSIAIGTGSLVFTTQAGLAYQNGARVRATATAGATGWLEGVATYSGTTLTIAADKTTGTGTGTAWNFNVAGQPGAGDLSSSNNLSDLANKATALGNLGGLAKASNLSDVANVVTARANLGFNKFPYIKRATTTFVTDATSSTDTVYEFICTAGGAGGGGSNSTTGAAGAGGGGGTCKGTFTGIAPNTTVTIVTGAGGSAGAASGGNGGGGGNSSISATGMTTITANGGGGGGGTTTTVGQPGAGGVGTTGSSYTTIAGGSGIFGTVQVSGNPNSGPGGGSFWGSGGGNSNPAQTIKGGDGLAPGAGGGGGTYTNQPGGAGASGIVEVIWISVQ